MRDVSRSRKPGVANTNTCTCAVYASRRADLKSKESKALLYSGEAELAEEEREIGALLL